MFVAIVIAVALVGLASAVLFSERRRREHAEATQRSIATVVGVEGSSGADLVRAIRDLQETASADEATALLLSGVVDRVDREVAVVSLQGPIVYENGAARLLLGRRGEGSVLRSRIIALAQRAIASGRSDSFEVSLHDPERRILDVTAIPMGDVLADLAVVFLHDVGEQRRVQAMRSDFVANASHELKTPLGALSLLAETLADAPDDATRARLAKRIRAESTRLARVVDDILRLAETEALALEFAPVSVKDVVERSVAAVATHAGEAGVELVVDEVAGLTVEGDRDQLVSAVENLLSNAITYIAVKDEPGTVRCAVSLEGDMVRVDVADTGIGIPDRYVDRVFERFFRVDRARSRESGGTGLGLSIVRNVAVAHGGRVELTSKVGVGSTFSLLLPVFGVAGGNIVPLDTQESNEGG